MPTASPEFARDSSDYCGLTIAGSGWPVSAVIGCTATVTNNQNKTAEGIIHVEDGTVYLLHNNPKLDGNYPTRDIAGYRYAWQLTVVDNILQTADMTQNYVRLVINDVVNTPTFDDAVEVIKGQSKMQFDRKATIELITANRDAFITQSRAENDKAQASLDALVAAYRASGKVNRCSEPLVTASAVKQRVDWYDSQLRNLNLCKADVIEAGEIAPDCLDKPENIVAALPRHKIQLVAC